jgi:hypothetical protein
MKNAFPLRGNELLSSFLNYMIPHIVFGMQQTWVQQIWMQQTASGQTNPYHDP